MNQRIRQAVLDRDKRCVVQRYHRHRCADTMGVPHSSNDVRRLTIEHVKEKGKPMMGKKAPDDPKHLVAVCGFANLFLCPRTEIRDQLRRHIGQRTII